MRTGIGVHVVGDDFPPRFVQQPERDVERRDPGAAPLRLAAEPSAAAADVEYRHSRQVPGPEQLP